MCLAIALLVVGLLALSFNPMLSTRPTSKYNYNCQNFHFTIGRLRGKGVFRSPGFPNSATNIADCLLYSFVGNVNQIVEIRFYQFNILRNPSTNKCAHVVDLFTDFTSPSLNVEVKSNYSLCGPIQKLPQTTFYSRRNVLMLMFSSLDGRSLGYPDNFGFKGKFKFIPKDNYKTHGRYIPGSTCSYDIRQSQWEIRKEDISNYIFSPRYPQNFPRNVRCWYRFTANVGYKVSISIHNAIFGSTGNLVCHQRNDEPFLLVIDGPLPSSNKYGMVCSLVNNLRYTSSQRHMLILFQSTNTTTAKGFVGSFHFVHQNLVKSNKTMYIPLSVTDRDFNREFMQKKRCVELFAHSNRSGAVTRFVSAVDGSGYVPDECTYTFVAKPNEIISLKLTDVYFQRTQHSKSECHDFSTANSRIGVYDGMSTAHAIVAIVCNSGQTVMVRSTGPYITLRAACRTSSGASGAPDVSCTSLRFTISYGFINRNSATKETSSIEQCKQNYIANGSINLGVVIVPSTKLISESRDDCIYTFEGIDGQRILLKFILPRKQPSSNIPARFPTCTGADSYEVQKYESQVMALTANKYCQHNLPSQMMSSSFPKLTLEWRRGSERYVSGVEIMYQFRNDYGVIQTGGKRMDKGCVFEFSSSYTHAGRFTSPNYPARYPEQIYCKYVFSGKLNEGVSILFQYIDIDHGLGRGCRDADQADYLHVTRCRGWPVRTTITSYRICGKSRSIKDRSIMWPESCLQLRFVSNKRYTGRGFAARYRFEPLAHVVSQLGMLTTGTANHQYGVPMIVVICVYVMLMYI